MMVHGICNVWPRGSCEHVLIFIFYAPFLMQWPFGRFREPCSTATVSHTARRTIIALSLCSFFYVSLGHFFRDECLFSFCLFLFPSKVY